jgi:hypothetical protein
MTELFGRMKRKTIVSESLQVMLAVILDALDLQGGAPPSRSGKLKNRLVMGSLHPPLGRWGLSKEVLHLVAQTVVRRHEDLRAFYFTRRVAPPVQ